MGRRRDLLTRASTLDDDFEVIPTRDTPAGQRRTSGTDGAHRFLFTGDTIYLRKGKWTAAVLDSSDRALYLKSLELIRELDFDVLVPWGATGGQPFYALTDRADTRRRVDALLEEIRRGPEPI